MAGSRVEKVGTIFTRNGEPNGVLTGLLRSGALREEDKPLWYDVYRAFPPKQEPRYDRPPSLKEVPNILYREDVIRAKFYKEFPNITIDMTAEHTTTLCERFILKYREIEYQQKDLSVHELFQSTAASLSLLSPSPSAEPRLADEAKPVISSASSSENELPGPKFKVTDVLGFGKENL